MRLRTLLLAAVTGLLAIVSTASSPLDAQSGCHTNTYLCGQDPCMRCQRWFCWTELSDGTLVTWAGEDSWDCFWNV